MRTTQYTGAKELRRLRGAFFTPAEYAIRTAQYVRSIIDSLPDHSFLIVDRCAGTGNLEDALIPIIDETTTTILAGTIDEAEQRELEAHFPSIQYHHGDALAEEYNVSLASKIAQFKATHPNPVVIFYENPPYCEPQGGATVKKALKGTSNNWLTERMKKEVRGRATSDLANKFIWSAFELHKCDYYVVYAPVKYWKSQHIIDKRLITGFIANRAKFGASEGGISVIAWRNEDTQNEELHLENATVRKIHTPINQLIPPYRKERRGDVAYEAAQGTPDRKNGWLTNDPSHRKLRDGRGGYADIMAEMESTSGFPAYNNGVLGNRPHPTKTARHDDITPHNILHILPLFVANCYKPKDYTEMGVLMKSGDGGLAYQSDAQFLLDCLVWTALSFESRCMSDDTRRNELCLLQDTKTDALLSSYPKTDIDTERWAPLLDEWAYLLNATKDVRNPMWTYGLRQLMAETDIDVRPFRKLLNEFYGRYIEPRLFEYQLIK